MLARVFAAFLLLGAIGADVFAAAYEISVRIEPDTRELSGTATIAVPRGQAVEIALGQRFKAERIVIDGTTVAAPRVAQGLSVWKLESANVERKLEMRWSGRLAALDTSLDHRQTLGADAAVTGAEGTFLPAASAWYPRMRGLMPGYRVTIDLPASQRGLVPGRLVEEKAANGRYRARFDFPHPAEGVDLMAGPYRVETRTIELSDKSVVLRTYFHPQIAELAQGYLDSVKGYIERYSNSIGTYPYSEFSVVSSPTPTGFGMPTLTYLGIDVLKLPFIRSTSLGHEVLHNWWGNGVYPDYARGNWAEGLTTFMADYAFRERESDDAARAMRLEWLRDFAAVPAGQDRPLAEFTSRTHGTSQIVGYNKAAMVFFMLRDLIGRDAFDAGIRRFWREQQFKTASWTALQKSFEAAAKRDLSAFFAQWLTRQGAPDVKLDSAESGDPVRVKLVQQAPAYSLQVPLAFRGGVNEEMRSANLDSAAATFLFKLDARPAEVALDLDLRLFRRLGRDEAPPILRQTMIDPSVQTVIVGSGATAIAQELAARMQDQPPRFRAEQDDTGRAPLLVIGLDADIGRWLKNRGLPSRPDTLKNGTAAAWTAVLPSGQSMTVIAARDAESLNALARPLPHYGRRSYVVFEGAKAIDMGVWPAKAQTVRLQ